MTFHSAQHIHFFGIGGIGVSALAQHALHLGKKVSGSDLKLTTITNNLKNKGVEVYEGQSLSHVSSDVDLVIYSVAISDFHPELIDGVRSRGVAFMNYPQALGAISEHKKTIAVSGTHGKTSTTAMLAKILIDAGLSPTVIVGSVMTEWQSNYVPGDGDIFLVEACEYERSFLELNPDIVVITNIEADHLDYYKNLQDVQNAFASLVEKLPESGHVVTQTQNETVQSAITTASCPVHDYISAPGDFTLKIPGKHNIENAKAAYKTAEILGVSPENIKESLENYAGVWRRFEYMGKTQSGSEVYDDYAHHPTEIEVTLRAAKNHFLHKKIVAIFQPHLFSRTKLLFKDFVKSFSDADEVILTPIYPAREPFDETISSEMLVAELNKSGISALHMESFEAVEFYIADNYTDNHVLLTLGAGSVRKIAEDITP